MGWRWVVDVVGLAGYVGEPDRGREGGQVDV